MKKFLLVLPILLMLAFSVFPVSSAQAQPVEYPAQLEYYDVQINLLLPRLDDFQYQYYVVNGRYYQALASHSTPPDVPTIPDGLYSSPSDQPETLAYFWEIAELPETLAWSFRIDTYDGEEGEGYVLIVQTVVSGGTWIRSVNFGPETWRSSDWYQLIEE